ncbi:flagellar type III secretion system protein FlhB [Paralcaligenes sp. KSB-10]|uniref:flagellar biosynthesis protein FlhB n=1 Tax=Paralcaligenes sp. KSB-10 TaxID=2901142 RepID=UPI001E56D7BF|nr:flagellar biosynthesis protein FlhB [Paralcaligenes sp. KSB-10]UHL65321.1 flagellar type III secretion system protein FlhB [Paralcaligenes sp. KSB-10]
MAEESDLEKTEPASPRRLDKAREEGQVVRSRELNTFALLAAGVGGLWIGGPDLYRNLSEIVHSGLWFDARLGRDTGVMLAVASRSAIQAVMALLPLFGVLAAVAILSSLALGGLLFSAKPLEPKFERLNPAKGLQRMLSSQTLVELIKTLAKATAIGTVGAMVIWHYRDRMIGLMRSTPSAALTEGMSLVALCCALIVGSLLLIVLIDVPWQLWSHYKKLKMSREDVRQEHKESDGDPHVKGRIRQQQRAMARRRMMAEVPRADVVVTNPTHFAVALKYQDGQGGAPRVVAKGSDLLAARIRKLAEEHSVPMLGAPPLARALYRNVDVGREIPAELYTAVAEVLAWVYQLRRWNAGQGVEPIRPSNLPIPRELDSPDLDTMAAIAS